MANICNFSMCVKGNRNDIESFYNAMSQEGNVYMGRGAVADIDYEYDENKALISGWCKWSIKGAMISNAISMRNEPDKWYWDKENEKLEIEFITLPEACEKWNLIIEAYSEEAGCGFQEHILIDKGNVLIDECIDYFEYYVEDFETKEDAENEFDIKITDDEWDDCDRYIYRGGFKSWDFEI